MTARSQEASEPLASETGLLIEVKALAERLRLGDQPGRAYIDAIGLRHRLHRAGLLAAEEELLLAAISRDKPASLAAMRHRFYLARICTLQERFQEAALYLDEMERVLGEHANIPESPYWHQTLLGERHYHEIGRSELFLGLGLLQRAALHVARARAAMGVYTEFLQEHGKTVQPAREVFQSLLEIDFELARMRYGPARALIERAQESTAFQGTNRYQLIKRLAAALDEEGLENSDRWDAALPLLAQVARGQGEAASGPQVDRIDACFRLVRSLSKRGDFEGASAWSLAARQQIGGERVVSADLLASMELDAHLADRSSDLSLKLDKAWQQAMDDRIQAWVSSPVRAGGRGILHFDKVEYVIDVGIRSGLWLGGEGGTRRAFERLAEPLQVSDFMRRLGIEPRSAAAQQAALKPGEVALFLFPTPTGGHGFLVTQSRIQHFESGAVRSIRDAADGLRAAIDAGYGRPAPNQSDALAGLEAASRAAWEAVGGQAIGLQGQLAGAESVFFVAADLAFGLPLEAMIVDGALLGERLCISHLPSLDFLCNLRDGSQPQLSRATVIADVPPAAWVDPLQRNLPSIDVGSRRAKGWLSEIGLPGKLALGVDGSVEAVSGGVLDDSDLVIVFAHGDSSADLERPAALLLGSSEDEGSDGRIDSSMIEGIRAPAAVMLLACSAGDGPQVLGGGGGNHLGGAFIAAGARAVILAPDRLAADVSAKLVDAWCAELGAGASVGDALRLARRRVRLDLAAPNPYHLAGLRLFGLPDLNCSSETQRSQKRRTNGTEAWRPGEGLRQRLLWSGLAALALAFFVVRRGLRAAS